MDQAVAPIPPPALINILRVVGIGMLLGMAVAIGPPLAYSFIDKTARSELELRRLTDMPVLESIPVLENVGQKDEQADAAEGGGQSQARNPEAIHEALVTVVDEENIANEFFRSLRTKIQLLLYGNENENIVFTSLNMSEGKSIIAANTAVAFARQGKKTILLDADLRRGAQHEVFAQERQPGLADFLSSEEQIEDRMIRSHLRPSGVKNLAIMPVGTFPPNPVELLSSPRLEQLVRRLRQEYDMVIIDTPPIGVGADVVMLHAIGCSYVVVAKAGSTNILELQRRIDEYPVVKRSIAGIVLNYSEIDSKRKYYKYTKYYRR
jgi:capsular exopolysaccharide synthesis family protein